MRIRMLLLLFTLSHGFKGTTRVLQTKVRKFNILDLDLIMDELDALNLQAVMMGQDHEKQLERLVSIFLILMFILFLTDV